MKIYFVLLRPSYWTSYVTTNENLANTKLAENTDYKLVSADIMPLDFVPVWGSYVGALGSCSADLHLIDLSENYYFTPIYKATHSEYPKSFQTIHKSDLAKLTEGGGNLRPSR